MGSISSVKNAILCMGSEFAQIYVISLKNLKSNSPCVGDMMAKLLKVLEEVKKHLKIQDLCERWEWVSQEQEKLENLINFKNTADTQFKQKSYRGACLNYGNALKMDISAKRWNSILFSNRAAANMYLKQYQEALMDCNSAISKDPTFQRAYLRRARANKALNKYHDR